VKELRAHGFDATGIDKHDPSTPHCTQGTIEEYIASAPFDAAVARLSMHHVAHLGAAFARIRAALAVGGLFVMQEFSWAAITPEVIAWVREHATDFGPNPHTADLWSGSIADVRPRWLERYGELHGGEAMLFAFDTYFTRRVLTPMPYLAWLIDRPDLVEAEGEAIAAGEIPALGFLCIGEAL